MSSQLVRNRNLCESTNHALIADEKPGVLTHYDLATGPQI